MMRKSILAVIVLLLCGCVSPAERQAELEKQEKERMAQYQEKCKSYGFTPATDQFSNCVMQLDQNGRQRAAAFAAAMFGTMQTQPRAPIYQPTPAPVMKLTPAPVITNTNCSGLGNSINCTSTSR